MGPSTKNNKCMGCNSRVTRKTQTLQCDTCHGWQCRDCFNDPDGSVLPGSLYRAVQNLQNFAWSCEPCNPGNLITKLLQSNTFTQEQLLAYGCSPELVGPLPPVLPYTHASVPTTPASDNSVTSVPRACYREPSNNEQDTCVFRRVGSQGDPPVLPATPVTTGPTSPAQADVNNIPNGQMMQLLVQQNQQMQQQHMEMFRMMQEEQRRDRQERSNELRTILNILGTQSPPTPLSPAPSSPGFATASVINSLPKVQLTTFDGNVMEWNDFWDSFNVNVHSNVQLSDKQKLDYLHQVIKGPAYGKIKGYGREGCSYDAALKTLHDFYADDDTQLDAYWTKLHNLPLVKENWSNLEEFIDDTRATTKVLERKGITPDALNAFVPEIRSKLPRALLNKVSELRYCRSETSQRLTMDQILSTLEHIRKINGNKNYSQLESTFSPSPPARNHLPSSPRFRPPPRQPTENDVTQKTNTCLFCKRIHYSSECQSVRDIQKRRDMAQAQNRCFKCLATGHRYNDCHSKKTCFFCQKSSHHSALCPENGTTRNQQSLTSHQRQVPQGKTEQSNSFLASQNENDQLVMAAFFCNVKNPATTRTKRLFVYMDSGAKHTSISQQAARSLNLVPERNVTLETGRFNSNDYDSVQASVVSFQLQDNDGYTRKLRAYSVPQLAPPLRMEPVRFSASTRRLLQHHEIINLPPTSKTSIAIDIIIGMDYYNQLMGRTITKIKENLHINHTTFGDILSGNDTMIGTSTMKPVMDTGIYFCQTNPKNAIDDLWVLENTAINTSRLPSDEDKVLLQVKELVTQKADGRYEVGFPWKEQDRRLSTNYYLAKKRLESTILALTSPKQATDTFDKYDKIIKDQLEKGIIEQVEKDHADGPLVHYIAHFPVVKNDRTTTKVRIVYDAKQKTRAEGRSVNDLIHAGPCTLRSLPGMLIRFRQHKIAFVSDIEKAFLQVGLRTADRDATRFLWLRDPNKRFTYDNIEIYRFTRIPFGIIASPSLLGTCVSVHLEKTPNAITNMIKHNIYVDNVIGGAETLTAAKEFYSIAKTTFDNAAMNLREWKSNNPEFNDHLPDKDKAHDTTIKVLGMNWNTDSDKLHIPAKFPEFQNLTKRAALQQLASVFDPLGLLSSVTVKGKILIRDIWKNTDGWDDPLTPEIQRHWNAFLKEVEQLPGYNFTRRTLQDPNKPVELLCFCDASPCAYATCVYVRQQTSAATTSHLVYAKTRVVPLKSTASIPQLELLATVLGSRILRFVEATVNIKVTAKHLWSDSQIALYWLTSDKDYNAYVVRRRREVCDPKDITLRYVDTKENPADLATRGVPFAKMLESNWLMGPTWIQQDSMVWPRWDPKLHTQPEMKELLSRPTRTQTCVSDSMQSSPGPFGIDPNRYSNLKKLLRITAYCDRFRFAVGKQSERMNTVSITTAEMKASTLLWIKHIQTQNYKLDIRQLENKQSTQLVKQLDLFLQDGVIKCGGRLANAMWPEDMKQPVLLPPKSVFTRLIILDTHAQVFHSGIKATLSRIRQRFWIPRGYSAVRKALSPCLICRKVQGAGFTPPKMAQLPPERVQRAPAFKYTGLDYLGPLEVRTNKDEAHTKRWIALFTCFTTRAIHLEMVYDNTAEAAVKAVTRFIGRRGTPHTILTDNATQFKKSRKVLNNIWSDQHQPDDTDNELFTTFYAAEGINWKFIPESSPWVGGFYERLVGLVKRAIKKTLWKMTLDDESMQTLIIQIEGVLNSRPLLALTSEQDLQMLTPAGFIAPMSQLAVPSSGEDPNDPDYSPDPRPRDTLTKIWKKIQRKLDQFWKVFNNQYLHELREAHAAFFKSHPGELKRKPEVGEVCLVKDNGPRNAWKFGKVTELVPSSDNETRFVRIALATGTTTKRGIKDVIPLETSFGKDAYKDETTALCVMINVAGKKQW